MALFLLFIIICKKRCKEPKCQKTKEKFLIQNPVHKLLEMISWAHVSSFSYAFSSCIFYSILLFMDFYICFSCWCFKPVCMKRFNKFSARWKQKNSVWILSMHRNTYIYNTCIHRFDLCWENEIRIYFLCFTSIPHKYFFYAIPFHLSFKTLNEAFSFS